MSDSGATSLVDVRLNNVSQLAGFAKRDDLEFFLWEICGIAYTHVPTLAPTQSILDEFKKSNGSWADYEQKFLGLMRERQIESAIDPVLMDNTILLCSEDKPHHCHRRLVAEYFSACWGGIEIRHLD